MANKVVEQAEQVLGALKTLDFSAIAGHDLAATKQLKAVLSDLRVGHLETESRVSEDHPESIQPEMLNTVDETELLESSSVETMSVNENNDTIISLLEQEGFEGRIGKVYNSFAAGRTMPFDESPHQNGLPNFEWVVAADYSPEKGLHGIFISDQQVMSIVLSLAKDKKHQWTLIKSKDYSTREDMLEYVTALSAGFDA